MKTTKQLGEGTYGIVYLCKSPVSNREYALKRNLTGKDVAFINAVREIDILNKVRGHPFIIELQQVIFDNQEICQGKISRMHHNQINDKLHFMFPKANYDLHHYIYDTTPSFRMLKIYLTQAMLGLEFLHQNSILHLDIKPANILIFNTGNHKVAKLCDFGMARPFSKQETNELGIISSWYRPPEITLGNENYDHRADVWSMGCVIYEAFKRHPLIDSIADDDNIIISSILGSLPKNCQLPDKRQIGSQDVKLYSFAFRKNVDTFIDKFRFNKLKKLRFEKYNNLKNLDELLSKMLTFDFRNRISIREALEDQFFIDLRPLIIDYLKFEPVIIPSSFIIRKCKERNHMVDMAIAIFDMNDTYGWYNHRILFQAMDIFDRYLAIVPDVTHDKFNSELRFLVCIYLSIKYFFGIREAPRFEDIVDDIFSTPESLKIAENFEQTLIVNYLEYDIYHPTIIEMYDTHILNDYEVSVLIGEYIKFEGEYAPIKIYQNFKNDLK